METESNGGDIKKVTTTARDNRSDVADKNDNTADGMEVAIDNQDKAATDKNQNLTQSIMEVQLENIHSTLFE